jgi:hypothetical protein
MRFAQAHLTFKALCVLDEAVAQARKAPVTPSAGLRFALAYLWSVSTAQDRHWFDELWRTVRGRGIHAATDHTAEHLRGTMAQTQFAAIARSVGVELTIEMANRMKIARGVQPWPPREGVTSSPPVSQD